MEFHGAKSSEKGRLHMTSSSPLKLPYYSRNVRVRIFFETLRKLLIVIIVTKSPFKKNCNLYFAKFLITTIENKQSNN